MDELKRAQQAVDEAKRRLVDAARTARAQGRTWADIGKELGMTRQAAFKRFGEPVDPENGETIGTRTSEGVRQRTEQVFALLAAGDYDGLEPLMHPQTTVELPASLLADTWRAVLSEVGALERCTDTHVELPGGAPLAEDEDVVGVVVGVTTLGCEAGELSGRVAFDESLRVVGLLIVPPDQKQFVF
jgi:hypothetical protein